MLIKETIILLSRPGCTLCDEVACNLRLLANDGNAPYQILQADVSEDQLLFDEFSARIPVMVKGQSASIIQERMEESTQAFNGDMLFSRASKNPHSDFLYYPFNQDQFMRWLNNA